MPYHRTKLVSDQPRIRLSHWRIMRTDEGDHHFAGFNADDWDVRVSTPILRFDVEQRRGTTQTGSIYQLEGPPDHDPHASWVWQSWMSINETIEAIDVTEELLSGHAAIVQAQG